MDQVKFEQIRILHRLSAPSYAFSFLVAVVIAFALGSLLSNAFWGVWLLSIALINAFRYAVGLYFTHLNEVSSTDRWVFIYCMGAVIAGCNWGVLAYQLDAEWDAVYQLILMTSIAGIIAGAIGSHASYFPALASFYSPILLAVVAVALKQDNAVYAWLAPLVLFFWAIVHSAGQRFATILRDNILMQQNLSYANEQLELVARLDGLTQLQNRSALEVYMGEVWPEYRVAKRPVSIAMIDVDMFKAYNDCYGHVKGDQCLTDVAQVLRDVIPVGMSFVGRYGGEEFIAVLPGHTLSEARIWMEQAQGALATAAIEHSGSTVSDKITVSIGIETAVPLSDNDWVELVDRADAKLYCAKQGGRNQIV